MYSPTKEDIAALKAEHGDDIFFLSFEDKACILKAPSRKVLSMAAVSASKDPLLYNETILKNCFVAGDVEIKEKTPYLLGAAAKLSDLIEIKEAKLEKL